MSRESWHRILHLFGSLFRGDSGNLGGRGGEGAFTMIWRNYSGVFESHPGTPIPSASYSLSLRLKVSIPGMVGVTMEAIVVHGEWRERIPGISGNWGIALECGENILKALFS